MTRQRNFNVRQCATCTIFLSTCTLHGFLIGKQLPPATQIVSVPSSIAGSSGLNEMWVWSRYLAVRENYYQLNDAHIVFQYCLLFDIFPQISFKFNNITNFCAKPGYYLLSYLTVSCKHNSARVSPIPIPLILVIEALVLFSPYKFSEVVVTHLRPPSAISLRACLEFRTTNFCTKLSSFSFSEYHLHTSSKNLLRPLLSSLCWILAGSISQFTLCLLLRFRIRIQNHSIMFELISLKLVNILTFFLIILAATSPFQMFLHLMNFFNATFDFFFN